MRKPLIVVSMLFISAILLTGCYRAKEYVYFQNLKSTIDTTKTTASDSTQNSENSITIQPFDQLDIRIKTSAKALESLTESGSSGSVLTGGGNSLGQSSSYLSGFQVDGNGNVNLPMLGSIYLKGLTIKQAKVKIKDLMKEYMIDPFIDIKFLTFRVTVLGEVASPGPKAIANERANLIDLIAQSGDLTDQANRLKIKVIRGDPRSPKVYELDITNTNSFYSPGFILQPNDIVYVEPLPRKFLFANLNEISPILTVANSFFIIFEFVKIIDPSFHF